jgi:hypothetical protein
MCDRARRQKRVSACFFRSACAVPFALARRRARWVGVVEGDRFGRSRRLLLPNENVGSACRRWVSIEPATAPMAAATAIDGIRV